MIIPGYKYPSNVCTMPESSRIVHHKKHSYDDKKNVIVIDDFDEDRQEFINSFESSVGLKNILKQLQLQGVNGIPASMAFDPAVDAVDVSGMPDNINDLKKAADEGDSVIRDAVKSFNEKYGTNYAPEEFIKKSADGSLMTEVAELLKSKDDEKKEGEI